MAMMASAQSQDIDFDRDIAPLLVRVVSNAIRRRTRRATSAWKHAISF